MIPYTVIFGRLLILMFAAIDLGGTITFGVLYGLFSGGFVPFITPIAASFSRNLNEIGQVLVRPLRDFYTDRFTMYSTRIGTTPFVISFALLTGNLVAGAVVQVNGFYIWHRPLVFASVGLYCQSRLAAENQFKVVLAGAACLTASRSILSKRKSTNRL
ncbi:hypothetical protein BDR07DRAFT_284394 [Suillus spraguei]|nr:hypothetical protein BDR07DRAFT_284394 [Suillus spraguei]